MSAALAALAPLPEGDPRRGFWTYRDLGIVFGLSAGTLKRRMPLWEAEGFPVPLPYSLREKRWRPAAVLAWRDRRERALGAAPPPPMPRFRIIEGGE